MKAELIYWDSDCFLGWLQGEAAKVDLCRGTLERAEGGQVGIITSSLTLAEVLWMKGAPKIPQDKATKLRAFFRRSYIRVYNLTRGVAESAQDLVWNQDVRPKDAVHVATALELKVLTLETFDQGLLDKTGIIGTPPLVIRKPLPPVQGALNLDHNP